MSQYLQIEFQSITIEQSSILIAQLSEIGFEGFEETEENLKAFIRVKEYEENAVEEIAKQQSISFSKTTIEETNWNQVWESNFNPS